MTGTKIDRAAELARPGDPLVLADGRVIEPLNLPSFLPAIKQDTKADPATFRGKRPRNLNELPAPANLMNAIGAVMLYSFFGVGDREISNALRCSVVEIENIRSHSAYAEYFELLSEQIISADSDTLQNRIAAYSHAALDKVAGISVYGKKEENVLRASIDLLDRGGHSAKNVAEKNKTQQNTLRIQVVKADGNETTVNVDYTQGGE